jgi:hypothetical protein
MPKALNQNQVLNYIADLPLLLGQARGFLDLKNRQGKEVDFKEIDLLLRVYALNLTLLSLEEFESLPFEKVYERLEWLFEQEKLISGERSVPVNLDELEAEAQKQKEKAAEEAAKQKILAQQVARVAEDLANRKKVLKALKEAQVQPEAQTSPDWQTIIESLPENEEIANDIQKRIDNPEQREELQKSWERLLSQQSLPPATLKKIEDLPLSSETFELLAGEIKKPAKEREILIEHLETVFRPLEEEEFARLKESLIANLVALSPLVEGLGLEGTAKSAAWQIKEEFKGIPPEQIESLAIRLAKAMPKLLPAEASIFSPAVIEIDGKMVPFMATQKIPHNPTGNPWLVKDADNQPLYYYWTINGVSPEEIEKQWQIRQRATGDPRSSKSLSEWAIKLREFQARYFSQDADAIVWQTNRIKAIFNASQVLSPLSKISQQAKDWFFQTSVGQSAKLWLARASQKSLEALWATAKIGIKTAVTKGVTAFLTRIGLQAVANTVAPVIGGLIAAAAEWLAKKGISSFFNRAGKALTSFFGLGDAVLAGVAGQQEVKDDSGTGKLAMVAVAGTIGLVAVLSLFTTANKDSALLGRGAGGPPSIPGLPVPKPPECEAPHTPRHLAEEIICLVTHSPCSQRQINGQSRESIGVCLDNITMVGLGALAGLKEVLQHYHCYYPPECPLQCLQFVIAVTNALGQSINLDFDYAGLYADNFPSTYKKVSDPSLGDVVVWRGDPGHIGIFIAKVDDSTKILVAEANFDLHGEIGLIERNGMGFGSGPSTYLRYCPSGNCQ